MYAYTQSFIETAFFGQKKKSLFWQNLWPDLSQSTSITAPFKNFVNLFSDCKLSLSRGSVGPGGDPHPSDGRNLSALCTPNVSSTQQNHFNFCTDVVWTLPTPGVWKCRSDVSGLCHCWEGGDTPNTHKHPFCVCGNPQLSSPWALFPVLHVVEADCSYLILFFLCFGDFLNQFLILFGFFFSFFWKEWCFFYSWGWSWGEGIGAWQRQTTTFLVLDFKFSVSSQPWAVTTGANCGQALHQ